MLKKNVFRIENWKKSTTYIVGSGLLSQLDSVEEIIQLNASKFLIISDSQIFKMYGQTIIDSLRKLEKPILPSLIEPGEKQKTFDSINTLIHPFFESGFDRRSVVVCIGGGVITDMGGFIASILFRGLKVVYIPTTLLSQIDAAIGGKTGIDYVVDGKMFKNMIGTITQPDVVISDIDTFSTLPERELICGLGEMAKYTVGWNKPSAIQLKAMLKRSLSPDELTKIVHECQNIKLAQIKDDPFDTLGIRESLNLGHTFAHALESATNTTLSHGEAVGVGLIAAAKLSSFIGYISTKRAQEILVFVASLKLPTKVTGLKPEAILSQMRMDKKGGTFVLLSNKGVMTRVNVDRSLIIKTLEEILI